MGHNLNLQGQLLAGENLTIKANNAAAIRDSQENPFIAASGNDLLIQGHIIDIFALNHPQSGLFAGGDLILRSPNPVMGDAHYWSGGNFSIENLDGSLGDLNTSTSSTGNAGSINVDAHQIDLKNAQIRALTSNRGNAGNINLNATEAIAISQTGSRIEAQSEGSGNAGSIFLTTPQLTINEGASISAFTSSSGDGGNIDITTPSQKP